MICVLVAPFAVGTGEILLTRYHRVEVDSACWAKTNSSVLVPFLLCVEKSTLHV